MTKTAEPSLRLVVLLAVFALTYCPAQSAKAQALKASGLDKERGHDMVSQIKSELKKEYYDPTFHGMDVDARFKLVDEKINSATSVGHIFGIIAQALIELEDSHTFFLPPGRIAKTEYGFDMQMVGYHCFVTAVKPGSDAEAKGLKEGDEIWQIDTFAPVRDNFWKIRYYYNALRPQPGMQLIVKRPSGKEEPLTVMAKITPLKRVVDLTNGGIYELIREAETSAHFSRQRYVEIGTPAARACIVIVNNEYTSIARNRLSLSYQSCFPWFFKLSTETTGAIAH